MISYFPVPSQGELFLLLVETSRDHWNEKILSNQSYTFKKTNQQKQKGSRKPRNQQPRSTRNSVANDPSLVSLIGKAMKAAVKPALMGAGGFAGSLFGPSGAAYGSSLGSSLSGIIGAGDYKVDENSLLTSPVPTFKNDTRTIRISHKEYLQDINSSILFNDLSFAIQPGSSSTFPWLSRIASNYTQYRMRGLIFEFRSTSATALNSINTALGAVIMSTQYNVGNPAFVTKQQMENYEFAVSGRPSVDMIHPVECSMAEQPYNIFYVRDSAVPSGQDPKLYDMGNFQIATVGMQAASVIGELWVSYDIEFFKPRLPGIRLGLFTQLYNSTYTNAAPLGTGIQTSVVSGIPFTITGTGTIINLDPSIGSGDYILTLIWTGVAAAWTAPSVVLSSNASANTAFGADTLSIVASPPTAVVTAVAAINYAFKVNGYAAAGATLTITGGLYPTVGTNLSLYLACVDDPSFL